MELIKIIEREGRQLVSGRELHEFLEIRTKYKDWFPRMVEYGFEEGIDFIRVAQKRATNNLKNPVTTVIDHAISIDMAKEISMIQRTEKGKQARLYFIECEKIAKNKLNSITVTENAAIANEYMKLLKTSAETLHMNESSILYISKKIYKDCNIPTTYLPDYTTSKGILKSATELLRKYNIQISTRKFNKIMLDKGLLREVERKSTKDNTKIKKFKNLVNTEFGENQVNPNNPKETQPMYYEEKFEELLKELGIK